MKSITISTYVLRVRNNQKNLEYHKLNGLPGGRNLFDLLLEYLDHLEERPANDIDNQSLLRASHLRRSGHTLSGLLERGEYGIKSSLVNIRKREITHERSVSEAEMLPFYFLMVVPSEGTKALVAFEMEGNTGINSQFERDFRSFLRRKCGECDLELDRLVPERLIKQYFSKGRVTKLRFVRFKVPTDIADAVKMGVDEQGSTIELQVKAKRGAAFSMGKEIQDVLRGQMSAREFVQVKGLDYDTIKIEFDMNGKRRTMDLTEPGSFRADYNITNRIEMYGGHPTYASIDRVAREIVREILPSIGLEARDV